MTLRATFAFGPRRTRWGRARMKWQANHQILADRAGRWRQIVPVTQPLLLVSQIQRSGGTLFTRLLQAHPECVAHPYELQWASKPSTPAPAWPDLDPAAPARVWWGRLQERWVARFVSRGHLRKSTDRQPLALVPGLHRQLFLALWKESPPTSRREVFNHYMTALFNVWADCAGIYASPKRYVVAFAPQVQVSRDNRDLFWEDYPDGLLVSIVRRPDHWIASARHLRSSAWTPGDAADAIRQWKASVQGTLQALTDAPDRTLVINFEALVQSPPDVMGRVCRVAGMTPTETWMPTFNGRPDPAGVTRAAQLPGEVRDLLDAEVWELYAAATAAAQRRPPHRTWSAPPSPIRPGPAMPIRVRCSRSSYGDRALVASRLASVRSIDQPILLISQIQRSGGTLLSRLLDAHPECHAHPYELTWGSPEKRDWPHLPMQASSSLWWERLLQQWQIRTAAIGAYHKQKEDSRRYPMVLHRRLQAAIWQQCLSESIPASQRDVLNASMTAFFNAWLDYQGWHQAPARYVTAFTPGVTTTPGSLDRYWRDYPDGHLVCLVREPQSWYVSARVHHRRWQDLGPALVDWKASAQSALDAKAERPDQVSVVLFEDLVGSLRATMLELCRQTGLSMHPSLMTPTFNTIPIVSNSSFVSVTGLDRTVLDRSAQLSALERDEIQACGGDLYSDISRQFGLASSAPSFHTVG